MSVAPPTHDSRTRRSSCRSRLLYPTTLSLVQPSLWCVSVPWRCVRYATEYGRGCGRLVAPVAFRSRQCVIHALRRGHTSHRPHMLVTTTTMRLWFKLPWVLLFFSHRNEMRMGLTYSGMSAQPHLQPRSVPTDSDCAQWQSSVNIHVRIASI